ncbi:MAG: serine--tRNA ligase, partial [Finegoldia magna]|nr:serine--tRNA ligase [Finegoldia magna]
MLDIKRIRNNPEEIVEALKKRRGEYPIQKLLDTDKKRREVIQKVESMKAEQNKLSKQVPQMKKNGEDTTELFKNLKKLSDDIKS